MNDKMKFNISLIDMQHSIAIGVAVLAHGQDKNKYSGELYINHPMRVMFSFVNRPILKINDYYENTERAIVAILHDVIEDTNITAYDLVEIYSIDKEYVDAVVSLTRKKDETYEEFILRVSKNKLAKDVKIEDIKDNLSRKETLSPSLEKRYTKALKQLEI